MKLFKIEFRIKRPRRERSGAEAIVHASSKAAAEKHIGSRYTGCTIVRTIELENVPKHFIVADLTD